MYREKEHMEQLTFVTGKSLLVCFDSSDTNHSGRPSSSYMNLKYINLYSSGSHKLFQKHVES